MTESLVGVILRNPNGTKERALYRVPEDVRLVALVDAAIAQSKMEGAVCCESVDLLGTLEPHLFGCYKPLMKLVVLSEQ